MFDQLLKDIKGLNSKANWTNLVAGIILLLVLVGGSLWYFGKRPSYQSTTSKNPVIPQINEEPLGTGGPNAGGSEEPLGTKGTGVTTLPNTSSR